MTPFFSITHALGALLLPCQHFQKRVKEGIYQYVVSLFVWPSCGDSEYCRHHGRTSALLHQENIPVLDLFFPISAVLRSLHFQRTSKPKVPAQLALPSLAFLSCVSQLTGLTEMPVLTVYRRNRTSEWLQGK